MNEWFQPLPLPVETQGISASTELALPLLATAQAAAQGMPAGRTFGILILQSMQPEAFSASQRLVFEVLANRLAAAIEAQRLYAQSAALQAETKARMAGMNSWMRSTARKIWVTGIRLQMAVPLRTAGR